MHSESRKTVYAAMAANFAIAVAKAAAGLLGSSPAMLAEAAHSVADTMNQVFLLVSLSLGDRKPDEEHPFGYGKERFFWAFLAAVFIFVSGAVFSLYEGLHALLGNEQAEASFVISYAVLGFSLLAEGASLVRATSQVRGDARAADVKLRTYLKNSTDTTVRTVLFEDSAAVTGVVLALLGVGLHHLTGERFWEGLASVAIGLLLVVIAYALGRDNKGLLIGEAARPEQRQLLRDVIMGHPEVEEVLELLTMHLGPSTLLVAVRLDLQDELSAGEVEELSNQIDGELRHAVSEVSQVFLDATPRPRPSWEEERQRV
ncbi:MAG TPA: cation diffusion facilitator family transporter [Actinomycetes bacterium]|jgi:cation diffusion facilitator family transporter|nr:cation diffusion facilitator family transporter [Actinomycetes bacterium]